MIEFKGVVSLILVATFTVANPVDLVSKNAVEMGTVCATASSNCPGYTRTGEIWNNGDARKNWKDLPLDTYPDDKNRTRAYYEDVCSVDNDAKKNGAYYTMSFVTLDDCQPMTKRYGPWNDNRSFTQRFYRGGNDLHYKTFDINPDGSATWLCPTDLEWPIIMYRYEVFYNGLHSSEFLENIGFKIVRVPL